MPTKTDWNKFDKGVFLVNVLGIIYNSKIGKILIGRREEDPYIKQLTWCFPGGRPIYGEELEDALKREIKSKTGLDVKVKKIVLARTLPEKREFLLIYYHCDFAGGKEKPGDKLVELKWVRPTEVKKYFTTSLHPKVFEYLKDLEKKKKLLSSHS